MNTDNESGCDHGGCADVERYEQLRSRALGGDAGGWRLGLAVLQHRGVSAWIRTCRAVPTGPAVAASTGPPLPVGAGDALVAALASMAAACAAGD